MATAVEESSVKVSEVKEEIKTGLTLSLTGFGGYEKFKVLTVGCPQAEALPNANVVVHMKANGINFFELMSLQGLYDKLPKPPFTPGYEGSGDIIMVGKDVDNFKVCFYFLCCSYSVDW